MLFVYPTKENFDEGYAGPGLFHDSENEVLFIRVDSTFDPNVSPIYISRGISPLYIRHGAGWTIKNLSLRHGSRANLFLRYDNSDDITVDNVFCLNAKYGILYWGNADNLTVRNSLIRNHHDPEWSWQDVKHPPNGAAKTMETTGIRVNRVTNSTFHHNDISGFFDGIGSSTQIDHGVINLNVHHNRIHDIFDDAISLDFGGKRMLIHHNDIYDVYVSLSLAPFEADSLDRVFVYRNVMASDKHILWDDAQGTPEYAKGSVLKLGGITSTDEPAQFASFYHNTMIGHSGAVKWSAHDEMWKDFEFYNNIIYGYETSPVRNTGFAAEGNAFDGNLYYRSNTGTLITRWNSAEPQNFQSLAEARQSPEGQAAGWEVHGVEGDPMFEGDIPVVSFGVAPNVRLKAGSPAINAGIALPSTWPGTEAAQDGLPDIGALERSPTTSVSGVLEQVMSVFPNPTSGTLYFKNLPCTNSSIDVRCTDLSGRSVFSTTVHASRTKPVLELNMGHLASGVYFISVHCEQGTLTERFVMVR